MERQFKLKQDPIDEKDFIFKATRYTESELPKIVDLRPYLSPIVDQGSLGSCTANAIASGFRENIEIKEGEPFTRLSRLYLYYKEREMEGTLTEDSGAYIRDGMKILQTLGCSPETYFPYDVTRFTDKPTAEADNAAGSYKIQEYHRITSCLDLQHALAEGLTVVVGATIYESFYSVGKDGIVSIPKDGESRLGGHAMLICGYELQKINGVDYVTVRNSWGEGWGDKGYCYMPFDYIRSINVTDMWTGTPLPPKKLTIDEAIDIIASKGIFDSPDFWKNLANKYKDDPDSDFRFVGLAFIKLAKYIAQF